MAFQCVGWMGGGEQSRLMIRIDGKVCRYKGGVIPKRSSSLLDSIDFCDIPYAHPETMDTIKEIFRDAPFGQLVRYTTRNRFFKYPEELPGFEIPSAYIEKGTSVSASQSQAPSDNSATAIRQPSPAPATTESPHVDLEKLPSRTAEGVNASDRNSTSTAPLPSHTLPFSPSRLEADLALHTTRSSNHVIAPVKTADCLILAEWYTTTDPANPQNWSQGKKAWTAFLICLYTFIVYAGSSIYVSSTLLVMSQFGVGAFKASLGLALYVLGVLLICVERYDRMGWIADHL